MSPEQIVLSGAVVLAATAGLTALALLANRVMPDAWVRERHDLAVTVVFLVPLIFLLTWLPGSPLKAVPQPAPAAPTTLSDGPTDPDVGIVPIPLAEYEALLAGGSEDAMIAPPAKPSLQEWMLGIPAWAYLALLGAWTVVSAGRFWVLFRDLQAVDALIRTATPIGIPEGFPLSSPIAMARSSDVISPMIAGYLRPVVLLPTHFRFDDAAAPVLEHEIAHADRHDNWIALGQRLVMAVFWWNGPLYALQPMIHGNREKLCDGRAVQVTGAAQALAHALLDVAARQVRQPALPLAVAGERSALAARIKRLASPDGLSHKRPVVTLAVLFPVLAVSALILTPRLGEASPASDASDGQAEIAYAAAHDGDVNAVRAMIEGGFDPDSPAPGDGTAMIGAVRGGHAGLVDMLLILGADPDVVVPGDGTALMAAARMGHVRLVKTLLEDGADPDLGSEGDGTPLILAAQKGHKIIAEYLLNAGADPNKAQPRDGNPLIAAARHGNKDLAHLLIKAGADPNGYVFRDETPLVNAARRGNIEMAKLLVSKGADVSLTVKAPAHDDSGPYRSPLSEAKRAQKSNMVAWLKQRGAEHRPPAE